MSIEVKLSVRTLVEYVYASGSIDSRFRTSTTMTDGTKVHQKIQKTYNESDQKEVYLQTEIPFEDLVFLIDGRCDGLLFSEEGVTVDEIKSTLRDLSEITESSHPVHWAQAKSYAYMYAKEHGLDRMQVQLTYVQVETEEAKRFAKTYSFEELARFVEGVVKSYAPFAQMRVLHEKRRNESIQALPFPFGSYRKGQRKLAGAVYKTIADNKNLYAKAPTGIGKTISTTFPAVKAIGEGLSGRIFYLTAKTITREAAEEAFSLMSEQGLCMNTVTITAKEKVCFKEETICNKDYCEFANGYYDRVNDAILDLFRNHTSINRAVIEEYARKHTLCPFEFSLDVAYAAADAVICDYNYIFDPRVSLKRFADEQRKHTVLLIDEAHNLVDRAREMFSADLRKSVFLDVKRKFKGKNADVHQAARAVNDHLLFLKKSCGEKRQLVMEELQEELIVLLDTFIAAAERELLKQQSDGDNELLLEAYFSAQAFVRIAKLYDSRYVTYVEVERSEVYVKQFCLDPSKLLRDMGKSYRSKIYFSATFMPLDYYQDMLGAEKGDYTLSVPSPFSREKIEVVIRALSTRYRDRENTKEAIAGGIFQMISERKGNYLIFFPSYQYMKLVYEDFIEAHPDVRTIIQDGRMTEEERELFLRQFQADNDGTLVGFAVLGGIFSEGVDLKGDRLNGVVVVGVGLPQIGLERDIIKGYFDREGKNGYDYAYVYPGMNKVLQAGGRLIRTEDDTGSIMLVDDRFLQRKYQTLLPYEWQHYRVDR